MKIGIMSGPIKQEPQAILTTAKAWGADGVQFYYRSGCYDFLKMNAAELAEIRTVAADLNLAIPALCGDLGGYGFERSEDNPRKIATTKQLIDIAVQLGAPVLTTHIGVIPEDQHSETWQTMLAALTELGEYACARHVTVAIETGPETPEVLRRFISGTRGGVGVNLDPANFAMILGVKAVDAVRTLDEYIVHTHAKDGVKYKPCDATKIYHAFASGGFAKLVEEGGRIFLETPLGEGDVHFETYISALRNIGYDGFLTIERETGTDPEGDIRRAVDFLRRIIGDRS